MPMSPREAVRILQIFYGPSGFQDFVLYSAQWPLEPIQWPHYIIYYKLYHTISYYDILYLKVQYKKVLYCTEMSYTILVHTMKRILY